MAQSWTVGSGLMLAALSGAACSGKVITAGAGGGASAVAGAGAPSQGGSKASAGAPSSVAGAGGAAPSASGAGGTGASASAVGGAPASAGGGAPASAGGAAGASTGFGCAGPCGLLTPTDGWIPVEGNLFGIQGALFAYADSYSASSMTTNFVGPNSCIAGTAAKVDLACIPVAPATDCYAMIWGAAIGLNLNQPIDPITMMGVQTPLPYDASDLRGFAFNLTGTQIPNPKDLRFQVETANQTFCNLQTVKLRPGDNTVLFTQLVSECFRAPENPDLRPTAESAKSLLTRISWHVLTNTSSAIPYDFCVSEIRAIH